MLDFLIRFFTYNKIYLFSGAALLLLIIIPTKEKVSSGTRKALYVFAVIWIICFAYRVSTSRDIIHLFKSGDDYAFESETKSPGVKGSPFNKYYSNEAGRQQK